MPYNLYVKGYTYKAFQDPNETQFGQKHQVNPEVRTQGCDTKGCPNYIKLQINTWLRKESKPTNDWFQNTSTHEVWYQKESNQHNKWSIRHQLKIRYQLKQNIN